MNKYLKTFLIVIAFLIGSAAIIAGVFFWSLESSKEAAGEDGEEQSALCDTLKYITEQPEINFIGFDRTEINTLQFQILRKGALIRDSLIKPDLTGAEKDASFVAAVMPYKKFLKTDTIVITTKNNLKYYVSNYHHYAYLHHGMMGYVGSSDCRFSTDCTVNNRDTNGSIERIYGWTDDKKKKNTKYINPADPEYEIFAAKSKIKLLDAQYIMDENRRDKRSAITSIYGIEIDGADSFYVFGEEGAGKDKRDDIIKINTKTGEFKRFTNYPFDNP